MCWPIAMWGMATIERQCLVYLLNPFTPLAPWCRLTPQISVCTFAGGVFTRQVHTACRALRVIIYFVICCLFICVSSQPTVCALCHHWCCHGHHEQKTGLWRCNVVRARCVDSAHRSFMCACLVRCNCLTYRISVLHTQTQFSTVQLYR